MKTRHLGSNLGSKQQKVPANAVFAGTSMAEKEGFEPSKPLWGLYDFQSYALDQATRLLHC